MATGGNCVAACHVTSESEPTLYAVTHKHMDGDRMPSLRYRGSIKHKRWRPGGGYGTLCPKWTHNAATRGLAGDTSNHPWEETQAHAMLA